MKTKHQICSEPDCYKDVDLELEAVKKPDGSYYERSLKCFDCRTDSDKRAIKANAKKWRKKVKQLQTNIGEQGNE
jgi:hypothetical protein